jgi:hypothetical protein
MTLEHYRNGIRYAAAIWERFGEQGG